MRSAAMAVVCLLLLLGCDSRREASPRFAVGVFCCDATPPIGHPLCGGWIKPLVAVDDPLLAKGIVFSDGKTRYVLCALDWCRLHGGAHDLMRKKLAAAAGIPMSQVAVQCLHQHNAPLVDVNAQLLLNKFENSPAHLDLRFMEQLAGRVADAVKKACKEMKPVTHIGLGMGKVERFASNRRVKLPDGSIFVRYSASKAAMAKEAPEGIIDPWLRTISFFDGQSPVARLHYYASHPMSYYGDGRASSDTAGLARRRMEEEEGVPQIYFTGCAGDITAGKYNNGTREDRAALTERLYLGMKAAVAATKRVPLTDARWLTTDVTFAPRTEPEFAEANQRKALGDASAKPLPRIKAALTLAWQERLKSRPAVELSALRMGNALILHLPGEAFIEYQLYAQRIRPDDFVAVASYGEGGPGYICTDEALAEGGYEPTMSLTGPPSERLLKEGIERLARDGGRE